MNKGDKSNTKQPLEALLKRYQYTESWYTCSAHVTAALCILRVVENGESIHPQISVEQAFKLGQKYPTAGIVHVLVGYQEDPDNEDDEDGGPDYDVVVSNIPGANTGNTYTVLMEYAEKLFREDKRFRTDVTKHINEANKPAKKRRK